MMRVERRISIEKSSADVFNCQRSFRVNPFVMDQSDLLALEFVIGMLGVVKELLRVVRLGHVAL